MADLKASEYKRFRAGIETQYNNLLAEKETELQSAEENKQRLYEQICYKWAEYEMLCGLSDDVPSTETEIVSDEIVRLIQEYDEQERQAKIDELKREIEWLKAQTNRI